MICTDAEWTVCHLDTQGPIVYTDLQAPELYKNVRPHHDTRHCRHHFKHTRPTSKS